QPDSLIVHLDNPEPVQVKCGLDGVHQFAFAQRSLNMKPDGHPIAFLRRLRSLASQSRVQPKQKLSIRRTLIVHEIEECFSPSLKIPLHLRNSFRKLMITWQNSF